LPLYVFQAILAAFGGAGHGSRRREEPMESDQAAIARTRALIKLPAEAGQRFAEEWTSVARRVEVVHGTPVPHETEPAGAPRLDVPDE